jgi:hypothetical protein
MGVIELPARCQRLLRLQRGVIATWQQIRDPGLLPPRTMVEETVLDLAQAAADFDDVVALLAKACQRRLTFPVLLRQSLDARSKSRWRARGWTGQLRRCGPDCQLPRS